MYVITKTISSVIYYYMGEKDKFTPMFEGAKIYEKKPTFSWAKTPPYTIEKISANKN